MSAKSLNNRKKRKYNGGKKIQNREQNKNIVIRSSGESVKCNGSAIYSQINIVTKYYIHYHSFS